jgi:hypothetical protein
MPRDDTPQNLARRMADRSAGRRASDGYRPDPFARYPKAAYMTEIESWRELPDGAIEFTMRRLPTAD